MSVKCSVHLGFLVSSFGVFAPWKAKERCPCIGRRAHVDWSHVGVIREKNVLPTLFTWQKQINIGNAMNYLSFVVQIVVVHDCEQCAVTPRDAIGGKEPVLIVVSWINTQRSLPLPPYQLPYPPKYLFSLLKFNCTYFSHNYYNYLMLW